MPELPDVEVFRAVLAEHGTGRLVIRVEVAGEPGFILAGRSANSDRPRARVHGQATGERSPPNWTRWLY